MIPPEWMPKGDVRRIVIHWTAGVRYPTPFDRLHYHFLIDAKGKVHRGLRPPGKYLPHTRGLNTGSIGVALCGMAGARSAPFHPGNHPLSAVQFAAAAQLGHALMERYGLPYTERSMLVHADVGRVFRVAQRGKWDVCAWPNQQGILVPVSAAAASHQFRLRARNGA
jgi:hypothetical protein